MNGRNLVIAALLLGAAVFVYRSFITQDQPATGAAMASVIVPQLSEPALAGEALFNRSCATCHGRNAAGQDYSEP